MAVITGIDGIEIVLQVAGAVVGIGLAAGVFARRGVTR
jgi:hypothetical protein